MVKFGTATGRTPTDPHIRKLRETGGIKLDLIKSGTNFVKYVVTDGEWNPANVDGKRVYDREEGTWRTIEDN